MSAYVAVLRAERPRPLRAAVRRLLRFRLRLVRRAGARRRLLVTLARERFDERAWLHTVADPRDDPRVHRWRHL
jgi:hypothetical protein